MKATPQMITLAKQFAVKHGISPALICATVEQESAWDQNARRYEPAFYRHYIIPLGLPELEGQERATSWGLLQTMLQSVVEIGYEGTGPQLLDPATNLEWGCKLFAKKLVAANGEAYNALLRWNGGSNPNYPSQVIDRMEKYTQNFITDEWQDDL